jgi:pyridoxal phosphate enzyme (YggS family)
MNEARLRENLAEVRGRIVEAARASGREPADVTLVGVTKRSPAESVARLVSLGVLDCGENYPQELWSKAEALSGLPVRWHLIGHLQGNKAKRTYPMVRFVHAVDSLKLLMTLEGLAADAVDPAPVCLQVNTSAEASKHGWDADALLAHADAIAACRAVPIVGLMTMAALGTDADSARPSFAALRALRDTLADRLGRPLPHLSMGMSGDYEAAVQEGATLVRVGSALFEGVEA